MTAIDGTPVEVVTTSDTRSTIRWVFSGFGVAFLALALTAVRWQVNTTRDIAEVRTIAAQYDSELGGHMRLRREVDALEQTMDELKHGQESQTDLMLSIARALNVKPAHK